MDCMKIVADRNIPAVESLFATIGTVEIVDGRTVTAADIADADVLLVRSVTRVDEALLARSQVRFVGSATSGRDHIDEPFLRAAGIGFASAPGSNARSVVEYVLAAICDAGDTLERLLRGGTLGIVGYGHVGSVLASLCDALGVRHCVFDPWLSAVPAAASLSQVLQCDVVSLHCELTTQEPWPSYHLLGKPELAQLRKGSLLINSCRGAVVDNKALLETLLDAPGFSVVLDVWEGEPVIDQHLLEQVTRGTPHIAGYSYDGKLAATKLLYRAVVNHFSLAPAAHATAPHPATNISLPAHYGLAQSVRHLIQARYAIAEDDERLRACTSGVEPAAAGHNFDRLRREYPVRRELLGSTVDYAGSDAAVLRAASALGCSLAGRG